MSRAVGLVALLSLVGGALAASGRQTPVFRVGVELVPVDVSVVDSEGNPVRGLAPEDFSLEVDGEPRQILSVEYISQVDGGGGVLEPPAHPHFSANDHPVVGRLIMIGVDESSVPFGEGRAVLETASRFLDTLTPADRVAVSVFPGPGPHIEFTANHEAVRRALGTVAGKAQELGGMFNVGISEALEIDRGSTLALNDAIARECDSLSPQCAEILEQEARSLARYTTVQTRASLGAMRALLGSLREVEGTKALVLISGGLVSDFDTLVEVTALGALAREAEVTIYVLHLDTPRFDASVSRLSPTASDDRLLRAHGLETLAGSARGALFRAIGNADYAFDRIGRELSGYYLLAFEPEGDDRDGKSHRIQVKVSHRGVTLRTRNDFSVDPGAATRTDSDVLSSLLRAPLLATKLPLRISTFTYRDVRNTSRARVLVAAEMDLDGPEETNVAVGFMLQDARGRVVGSATGRTSTSPYVAAAVVEPGRYSLKLAAVDADGRQGSVEHDVDATLVEHGPLRLGDFMLTEGFDRLGAPARPTIDAATTRRLLGYLELYGSERDLSRVAATLEVAETEAGEPLLSADAEPTQASKDRTVVQGVLPIDLLPPGAYLARAVVSAPDGRTTTLTRPFRVSPALAAAADPEAGEVEESLLGIRAEPVPFSRDHALDPDFVGFFLDQLGELQMEPPSAQLQDALVAARGGDLERAAEQAPDDSPDERLASAFLKGLAAYGKGDLRRADAHFKIASRLSSEFFPAIVYMGACFAAAGNDADAAAAWQTALSVDTDAPPTFLLLSDALFRLNDGHQAVAILEEAAELWPQDERFGRRLATAYAMVGNRAAALSRLTPYLERHPEDVDGLFLATRLLYEARIAGIPLTTASEDLVLARRFAHAYRVASGPRHPIVSRWLRFMEADQP